MYTNASHQEFVLWGSSGHAKVLNEIIELRGGKVVAVCDNSKDAISVIEHAPLLIGERAFHEWVERYVSTSSLLGLAAIGGTRGQDRLNIHQLFRAAGVTPHTLIHPAATVSRSAVLEQGCQILGNAVLAADVRLGEACIMNHGSQLDHECILAAGVHLAPGSVVCGCVEIGATAMIGAGAVVLPRLRIGPNAIVGAGAVVTKDVPAGAVVVGNPAKRIR